MGGLTGGCQCGAVRFCVNGGLGRATLCHCRMCQKAFGSFYGALVSVKVADLTWTRGEPKRFDSSNKVKRGFCGDCGTPLTFEWSTAVIELAIATFDDPAPHQPVAQLAMDAAVPWLSQLADLPASTFGDDAAMDSHYNSIVPYQHPDHDTEVWPPAKA